jgi:dihydroflavonol-4-reductase
VKALVTGGTGFLGAHIVRELLKDGAAVKVLVREGSDRRNLAGIAVEVVEGDLLDKLSLTKALNGCDTLFHAAADYRLWTGNPAEMYAVNVDGTENILAAALAAGIEKVVYTSSVGTLGNPGNGTPGDETSPVGLADMVGHYKKSKFLAERRAEAFMPQGLPLVIVNPSTPVGPLDRRPTPTGKIIVDFLAGRMPAYLHTGLNILPVEDCAKGHILAARKGRSGEKYILGGVDITLAGLLTMLSEISGLPAPQICLPYGPTLAAAWINEVFSAITGKEPLIPLAGVQMAKKLMYFSSKKAKMELGFETTSAYTALERAVEWFQANGYIEPKNILSRDAATNATKNG